MAAELLPPLLVFTYFPTKTTRGYYFAMIIVKTFLPVIVVAILGIITIEQTIAEAPQGGGGGACAPLIPENNALISQDP